MIRLDKLLKIYYGSISRVKKQKLELTGDRQLLLKKAQRVQKWMKTQIMHETLSLCPVKISENTDGGQRVPYAFVTRNHKSLITTIKHTRQKKKKNPE